MGLQYNTFSAMDSFKHYSNQKIGLQCLVQQRRSQLINRFDAKLALRLRTHQTIHTPAHGASCHLSCATQHQDLKHNGGTPGSAVRPLLSGRLILYWGGGGV